MKKHHLCNLLVGLVLAVLLTLVLLQYLGNNHEIQSKGEWSVLQELEYNHRGEQNLPRVIVKQLHEYSAIGIVSKNNQVRVWVLLNPEFDPLIKELPKEDFYLYPDELESILSEAEVSEVAEAYLSNLISDRLLSHDGAPNRPLIFWVY